MFGAAKRAHHAREEQMRRDTAIRNQYEAQQRAAQSALDQQMREAREREAKFERQNQILLQQLQDMTIQNQQAIDNQRSFYEQQNAQAQAAADAQIAGLNDLMVQNQAQFDEQYGIMSAQYEAAQAAYLDQQRMAQNAARASVPGQQATATAPVVGDDTSLVQAGRKQANNNLSSLSIVGSPSNNVRQPLAGLQIA